MPRAASAALQYFPACLRQTGNRCKSDLPCSQDALMPGLVSFFGTGTHMVARVAAVVVAAGRGLRAGGDQPKQYRMIAGHPVIRPSLATLAGHPAIGAVQPVIHPEDLHRFDGASAGLALLPAAFGGATRQASVRAGLEALASRKPDLVLVHDAARPFASTALISRAIAA